MLSPSERALLESLLRQYRTDPYNFPDSAVAQINRLLAQSREAVQEVQREFNLPPVRRVARNPLTGRYESLEIRGGEPISPGYYVYRRIIESEIPVDGRTIRLIRVASPMPLSGRRLELAFEEEIRRVRDLIRYSGPLWYVSPESIGRPPPPGYVPFNPLGRYYDDYEDMEFDFDLEGENEYDRDYDGDTP